MDCEPAEDVTPTWEALMPHMLYVIKHGTDDASVERMKIEFIALAQFADHWTERIRGRRKRD